MRGRTGVTLSISGAVLLIIAVVMLFVTPAPKDGQTNDITEVTQEIKAEEEIDTTTEYQEESEQETSQEQAVSNSDSKLQSSTEQAPHAMNPEVYKWPCGRKHFQNMEEPRQVVEFAKYKEYYEQIAQHFLEYEGKDVDFYANKNGLYFDECLNEGSVKVSYDRENLMDLLEKSKVNSIHVTNDYIIFRNTFSNDNYIMYFYDETLTYNDPLPSDKDNWISSSMVNIAPHWWWDYLGPGD